MQSDNRKLKVTRPKASFFVGFAITRCLSTSPHYTIGQGGSILLVYQSMIVLKPAIRQGLSQL